MQMRGGAWEGLLRRGDGSRRNREGADVKKRRKNTAVTGLLTVAALTVVLLILLRDHADTMIAAISGLSLPDLLLLIGLGFLYQFFEACICCAMVRTRLPDFPLRRALKVIYLKLFGSVVSLGSASILLECYALHQNGLSAGSGTGLMTLEYVFHKISITLYATVALAVQWPWLRQSSPGLARYLLPAYFAIALIIAALVLLCTWSGIQRAALRLIEWLPDTDKWNRRRETCREQLQAVYVESHALFANRACCVKILALNAVKLFTLYAIPCLCMRILDVESPGFCQMQALAAVMLFLISILPNVAGMGPTELAFLLIFSPYVGEGTAASALILYRISTYYAPMVMGIYPFCTIRTP